ncbi:MAG TPA: Gfo/Idh/MocA family oxidoreductase [Candidatus Nitrosotenuis sp.]|nr:Gfo/Idh/MocA family oxidoreductase [Candidatus Nitrosotenuis sp.]
MEPLRIGLVGCGSIGELRAKAIKKNTNCRLVAVSDVDAARAAGFAVKFGAAAEKDWASVLRRADVDAVVISTPPNSHAEIAIAALQAGKHVLCEKPLARTPDECRQMIAAAQAAGRTLATGFNYRFYPSVMKAREFFDAGAIGELDHIRAYTGYTADAHNQPWIRDVAVMGGGALRDNGIHLIDTVLYFFGEPAEVKGCGTERVWKFQGCEDNGFAILRNAAGNVATLHASWTEWTGYKFSVEIYGTRGCIRIRCFPMITEIVSGGVDSPRGSRRAFYFPFVHIMEHLQSYRWIVVQSFVKEFDEFRAAIAGKKSAIASGRDGLLAVDVAHRACIACIGN